MTPEDLNSEVEEIFFARQGPGKHVPAATNTQATIEILLETMFSIRSLQRGYKGRELLVVMSAVELCKGG
jgi:hypothetical protein